MNGLEDTAGFGVPLKTSETNDEGGPGSSGVSSGSAATISSNSSLASLSTSTPNSVNAEDKENRSPGASKNDKPSVRFDPNPTILLTGSDGSPMKNYYPPRKDGAPDPSTATAKKTTNPAQNLDDQPEDCYLKELYNQIDNVVSSKPDEREKINQDEAEDPKAVPLIWVSKWVDYSDKYGLGYQFSDDSIGVFYNDLTKLMLLPDGESMHYIDRSGNEFYHTIKKYPENLDKKVTLLRYFNNYMKEHLIKAAATMCPRESEIMTRVHCLRTYFRTRSAIVIHISNGTLQINFFEDHTKIILCPLMEAVTYIDKEKNFKTYKLSGLKEHGCSTDLANRLRYAKNMIYNLLLKKSSSSKASEQQEPSSSKTATITNAQKV